MKLNWCKVKEENALRHIEFVDVTATNPVDKTATVCYRKQSRRYST